jgi:outer membrane protein OmpA-like peptidoglycan-associated protein
MRLPAVFCLLAVALIGLSERAVAQAPQTADEIIEKLNRAPPASPTQRRTRGLSAPPGSAGQAPGTPYPAQPTATGQESVAIPIEPPGEKAAVEQIFKAPPQTLSVQQRQQLADIAQEKPAIDLTIYFDFNSAEVGARAIPGLVELGKALSSDSLRGTRFLLAGHTDAKGSDAYNLRLSQRRADAIKRFLVDQFRIDERRLLAIGYGEEQLKVTTDPHADENRRVQVVNFGG